jgi:hypothetical protein
MRTAGVISGLLPGTEKAGEDFRQPMFLMELLTLLLCCAYSFKLYNSTGYIYYISYWYIKLAYN